MAGVPEPILKRAEYKSMEMEGKLDELKARKESLGLKWELLK